MKVALVQMRATDRKSDNVSKAVHFIRQAIQKKAKFILLPEVFNSRGVPTDSKEFKAQSESIPGPSIRPLIELSKINNVHILAGSICESIEGSKKSYNTSVFISPNGRIFLYRKIHLFNANLGRYGIRESNDFKPGDQVVMRKIAPLNIGLSVCFDLRFPELYRKYFMMGAHILCVPSNFTKVTGAAHWEVLLRARAIENLCYVLAPNQVGSDNRGIESYGNSMIVDPWGQILAKASARKEENIYADLLMENIQKCRNALPNAHRLAKPLA